MGLDSAEIAVGRVEHNLLDNRWHYLYPGGGDYRDLFRQLDVSSQAQAREVDVSAWATGAQTVRAGDLPKLHVGRHCKDPYPRPFHAYRLAPEPPGSAHPMELLPQAAGESLSKTLRASQGYTSLLEPRPEELTGAQAALHCIGAFNRPTTPVGP